MPRLRRSAAPARNTPARRTPPDGGSIVVASPRSLPTPSSDRRARTERSRGRTRWDRRASSRGSLVQQDFDRRLFDDGERLVGELQHRIGGVAHDRLVRILRFVSCSSVRVSPAESNSPTGTVSSLASTDGACRSTCGTVGGFHAPSRDPGGSAENPAGFGGDHRRHTRAVARAPAVRTSRARPAVRSATSRARREGAVGDFALARRCGRRLRALGGRARSATSRARPAVRSATSRARSGGAVGDFARSAGGAVGDFARPGIGGGWVGFVRGVEPSAAGAVSVGTGVSTASRIACSSALRASEPGGGGGTVRGGRLRGPAPSDSAGAASVGAASGVDSAGLAGGPSRCV